MLSWVSITAFGYAVVPDVNWISSRSLGRTSAASRSSSPSVTPAPSARKSSQLRPAAGHLVADDDHVLAAAAARRPAARASTAGSAARSERQEIDVEKAIGHEQRLHVGLAQAEGELRRLEARVDRHRDGAERRRRIEQRHPVLVVAHQDADEIAAPHAERMHRLGGVAHSVGLLAVAPARGRRDQRLGVAAAVRALRRKLGRASAAVQLMSSSSKPPMRGAPVRPAPGSPRWRAARLASAPRGSSSKP